MKQFRAGDKCADEHGNDKGFPYHPIKALCPKRLVCNVGKTANTPANMVTFPKGKGPKIQKTDSRGAVMKCRVKNKPKKRKSVTQTEDQFPGLLERDTYVLIERSIRFLTNEQQTYIRPFILPPIHIYLDDVQLKAPAAKADILMSEDFPHFATFQDYLYAAEMIKERPINQNHSYYTVMTMTLLFLGAHVEAVRFNPVKKKFTIFQTGERVHDKNNREYEEQRRYRKVVRRFINDKEYKIQFKDMDQQKPGDVGCGLYAVHNLMAAILKSPRKSGHTKTKIKLAKRHQETWKNILPPPVPIPRTAKGTPMGTEEYYRQYEARQEEIRGTLGNLFAMDASFDYAPFKKPRRITTS